MRVASRLSFVNRVIQDSRGCLWLATLGGLARFDGIRLRALLFTVGSELARAVCQSASKLADLRNPKFLGVPLREYSLPPNLRGQAGKAELIGAEDGFRANSRRRPVWKRSARLPSCPRSWRRSSSHCWPRESRRLRRPCKRTAPMPSRRPVHKFPATRSRWPPLRGGGASAEWIFRQLEQKL